MTALQRAGTLLLLGGAIVALWLAGATDLLSLQRAERLRTIVLAYGPVAPVMFVVLYVIGGLAFVPGSVLTLLGGVIFGQWRGLIYSSIGSTVGACVAFLIARYGARGLVEAWASGNPRLQRVDALVSRHGFRVVMFTRLVPVLPFGVLNYSYGLTGISFGAYAVTSWVCMLPATAVLAFTAGAVTAGSWDPRRTLEWLALGAVVLLLVTLVPGWLVRRSATLREIRDLR
jgi:uncharacterized membrane protein YdjX (TVP38/TMEM64 family)